MTQIVLDGVIENQRQEAEAEINRILGNFFAETTNPIDAVIITENFGEKISELTNSHFDARHEYGQAAAKTIPSIKDDKLVFTIILDGKIFGRCLKEEMIFRSSILLHELTHVDYEYFVWEKIGTDEFFKKPSGCRDAILHNASAVWEEYDASRVTMEFLANLAKQFKGEVNDTMTSGNSQQLYDTIKGIRNFVKQHIHDYMLYKISLGNLQYLVSLRIASALILWAYTVPAVGIDKKVTEIYAEIKKLEDYSVFSENIKNIEAILQELYQRRKEYLPELIAKIATEMELIIKKCGLTFTDLSNGSTYIHVEELSF